MWTDALTTRESNVGVNLFACYLEGDGIGSFASLACSETVGGKERLVGRAEIDPPVVDRRVCEFDVTAGEHSENPFIVLESIEYQVSWTALPLLVVARTIASA